MVPFRIDWLVFCFLKKIETKIKGLNTHIKENIFEVSKTCQPNKLVTNDNINLKTNYNPLQVRIC